MMRSIGGNSSCASAGATSRFGPRVKSPATFNPIRSEKTGFVIIFLPKKSIRDRRMADPRGGQRVVIPGARIGPKSRSPDRIIVREHFPETCERRGAEPAWAKGAPTIPAPSVEMNFLRDDIERVPLVVLQQHESGRNPPLPHVDEKNSTEVHQRTPKIYQRSTTPHLVLHSGFLNIRAQCHLSMNFGVFLNPLIIALELNVLNVIFITAFEYAPGGADTTIVRGRVS